MTLFEHETRSFPIKTKSICPECQKVIDATLYEEDGKVLIEKTCPEHGKVTDIYWSDAELFQKVERWWLDSIPLENPRTREKNGCPFDCGLCDKHRSHTALALIDVTNRCNLRCPICFANAAVTGYVYEPSLEQIRFMLENFRSNRPIPAPAVQFAGGEPTVREDLPEIIRMAKEVGFPHVEIATNAIKLAESVDYCQELKDAGLSTPYMQFDGLTPEPYKVARGVNLLPKKLKAIENCRKVGLSSIVLVPTVVRGVNDDQIGDIIKFAVENVDVVRGVIFQPVSITGRIDESKRMDMRITIPDVMRKCEEQTEGKIKYEDFYPCSTPAPLSRALSAYTGKPVVEFGNNVHCGMATIIRVEDDGEYYPITHYVDVERFLGTLEKAAKDFEGGRLARTKGKIRTVLGTLRFFKKKGTLFSLIRRVMSTGEYDALGDFMRSVILIGMMHFQDPYNLDIERVNRCVIHYGTPDGRIIPFCTYNSIHRPRVEKQFSIPVEEYRKQKGIKEVAPAQLTEGS